MLVLPIWVVKTLVVIIFENPDPNRKVISLGIVDPIEKKYWMIEASLLILQSNVTH